MAKKKPDLRRCNDKFTNPTNGYMADAAARLIPMLTMPPERILSDPDGGIVIYFAGGGRTADGMAFNRLVSFSFLNDGEALLTFVDRDTSTQRVDEIDSENLVNAIRAAIEFLD